MTTVVPALFVKCGSVLRQVTPLEASTAMQAARDACGLGGSKMPNLKLYNSEGRQTGYVSYNGRVWLGPEMFMGGQIEIPLPGVKTAAQREAEGWR